MQGRFDEGREQLLTGRSFLEDLGARLMWASTTHAAAMLELLANDPGAAERTARGGYDSLRDMGERGYLATTAAFLAEALCRQGRLDEADQLSRVSEDLVVSDDLDTQGRWRVARAKVLAQRGELDRAETLAREAVALIEPTDWLDLRGDFLLSLAEIFQLADKQADAARAAEEAVRLFEAKGNVVSAHRARAFVDELDARVS